MKTKLISKNKSVLIMIAVGFVLFVFVAALFSQPKDNTPAPSNSPTATGPKPTLDYKELAVFNKSTALQERHYQTEISKPNEDKVRSIISNLQTLCPSDKVCNIMLWDSFSAYVYRKEKSLSDEYAAANNEGLAGFLNSGGLFYYYGTDRGVWVH